MSLCTSKHYLRTMMTMRALKDRRRYYEMCLFNSFQLFFFTRHSFVRINAYGITWVLHSLGYIFDAYFKNVCEVLNPRCLYFPKCPVSVPTSKMSGWTPATSIYRWSAAKGQKTLKPQELLELLFFSFWTLS